MFMNFYNAWFYPLPFPSRMKSMDVLLSPVALFKLFLPLCLQKLHKLYCIVITKPFLIEIFFVRRHGVVGGNPAFQPGGRASSIPDEARNFKIYSRIGCNVFCVLSCIVSGGGPNIVMTTHSGRSTPMYLSNVLVNNLLFPLQASDPQTFEL